jgi:RNA-binding protein
MNTLTASTKRSLRSKAHHLKPIILIGEKGFTEPVRIEIDRALYDHELIKIKMAVADQEEAMAMTDTIALALQAEVVQHIGHTVVLYRKSDKHAKVQK